MYVVQTTKEGNHADETTQVDLESSEEDLSDILSELAVLSSCASSHVTKYKSAFLRKQTLWIVMEYLGGGSCADLLKTPPHHLSESHIAIICRELLLGLSYLHGEGKLHRDIKAANVLLGMDGRVKLADFGVAAQLTGLKSMRNTFVGTPFWMAPEVIQQEGHDARADVWSLGITAMELANGQPPHANVHPMKVLFQIPKQPAPRLDGNWSKDFREFVALCLTKDPDHRPTAKQMLKHRFIRYAGRVEGLQEMIQKKQEWESSRGGERNLKYYAETLRQLKVPQAKEDDDWLFDTVKAVPQRRTSAAHTQKKRSVQRTSDVVMTDEATTMMGDLSLDKTPDRRSSGRQEQHEANSSVRRSSTRKRLPSNQYRQPLGVNMSFGNSPSTVRQFRRVSPTTNAENEDPLQARSMSSLKLDDESDRVSQRSSSVSFDQGSVIYSPSPLSRFSSQASTINSESKEASLGRAIYSQAVGIACQDVLNDTADQSRREAVSRVAEALSGLEAADAEGLYHIMQGIIRKMEDDPRLKEMLPQPRNVSASRKVSLVLEESGTVQRTPSKASKAAKQDEMRSASPTKLVLAQNNPHLKSHRRRQSAQVVSRDVSQVLSPKVSKKDAEEKELDRLIKGSGALPHVSAMESCMYDRWLDGLRVRWPAL